MNEPLLRRVAQAIVDEPEKFDMASWCGTACCIAGWAVRLAGEQGELDKFRQSNPGLVSARARQLLELDTEQAIRLFHSSNWPVQFFLSMSTAPVLSARADIGRQRIEHFIETGQ